MDLFKYISENYLKIAQNELDIRSMHLYKIGNIYAAFQKSSYKLKQTIKDADIMATHIPGTPDTLIVTVISAPQKLILDDKYGTPVGSALHLTYKIRPVSESAYEKWQQKTLKNLLSI